MVPTASEIKNPEPVLWVENECVWSKNDVFSMVGGLGGDLYKDKYETKLFGMHSGSVMRGWNAGNANNDLKMSIYLFVGWGTCTYTGSTGVIFSMFGGLGGDFCKDTHEAKLFGMHTGSV